MSRPDRSTLQASIVGRAAASQAQARCSAPPGWPEASEPVAFVAHGAQIAAASTRAIDAVAQQLAACPDERVVLFDDGGGERTSKGRDGSERLEATRIALLERGVASAQIAIRDAASIRWDGCDCCCGTEDPIAYPINPVSPNPQPGPPPSPITPAQPGSDASGSSNANVNISEAAGQMQRLTPTTATIVNVWGPASAVPGAPASDGAAAAAGRTGAQLDDLSFSGLLIPGLLLLLIALAAAALLLKGRTRESYSARPWFRRRREASSFDDLTRIRGIDGRTAALLATLGVTRHEQIAGWRRRYIDDIYRSLAGRHGSIDRDDWVGQARVLLDRDNQGPTQTVTHPEPVAHPRASDHVASVVASPRTHASTRAHSSKSVVRKTYDRAQLAANLHANSIDIPILTESVANRFADQVANYSDLHLLIIETISQQGSLRESDLAGLVAPYTQVGSEAQDRALHQLLGNLTSSGLVRRVGGRSDEHASGVSKAASHAHVRAGADEVASVVEDRCELTEMGQQFVHYVMAQAPD